MYLKFAELWNATDKEIEDFVEKNGSLGIDAWKWERFITVDEKLYAIEWNSAKAVPVNEILPVIETPEAIRKEARKMRVVIELVQTARKFKDVWFQMAGRIEKRGKNKWELIAYKEVMDYKDRKPGDKIKKGQPLYPSKIVTIEQACERENCKDCPQDSLVIKGFTLEHFNKALKSKKKHCLIRAKVNNLLYEFMDEVTVDAEKKLREVLIEFMRVMDYEPGSGIIEGHPVYLLERADSFLIDFFNTALLHVSPQIRILIGTLPLLDLQNRLLQSQKPEDLAPIMEELKHQEGVKLPENFSDLSFEEKKQALLGLDIDYGETSLDFTYSCLLAQIWYALITDIIKKVPPRICKHCGELFKPNKAWGEYCSTAHQEAAKSRRHRRNKGQTNKRGRPPKKREGGITNGRAD
jgi:hypothetical protein